MRKTKSYQELKEEFDIKVALLQEYCKHENQTDWMEEQWAPGHGTGSLVKMCQVCYKIIDRKSQFPLVLTNKAYFDNTMTVSRI